MLAEALSLEDFDVRSAAHGRDASVDQERWRPHLSLIDLRTPIMDGWPPRAGLRRRPKLAGLPVTVLSATLSASNDSDDLATEPYASASPRRHGPSPP